jgi:uncharacterized protein (DUF983 family)
MVLTVTAVAVTVMATITMMMCLLKLRHIREAVIVGTYNIKQK